jgi:glutathione peroxidase
MWNFGKFLVDKQGKVIARFNPRVAPDAPELTAAIEKTLG